MKVVVTSTIGDAQNIVHFRLLHAWHICQLLYIT